MMKNIYANPNSEYLAKTKTWHSEDSPWKADQILKMLNKHPIDPKTIVEVGCGVGEILCHLNEKIGDETILFEGYDIAYDAINIAKKKDVPNIKFYQEDFTTHKREDYDLLLMIDVFEHVPDYLGFIEKCRTKAKFKIYHIPLDIHLSALLRNKMVAARRGLGHLHYFTKETALATLEDTGQKIVDYFYTNGAEISRKPRTKIANFPRKIMYPIMPDMTVKLLGGFSLLVLTE